MNLSTLRKNGFIFFHFGKVSGYYFACKGTSPTVELYSPQHTKKKLVSLMQMKFIAYKKGRTCRYQHVSLKIHAKQIARKLNLVTSNPVALKFRYDDHD